MTIYVDDPVTVNRRFPNYCHLWSDSYNLRELHEFAVSLGLKRAWFQSGDHNFPHYDISQAKRALALRQGAFYKPLKDYILERKAAKREMK